MKRSKQRVSLLFLCLLAALLFCNTADAGALQGTVTGYEKIHWGVYTGRYYVNGIHAFCAAYSKTSPSVGTEISSIIICENEIIRKALYYGYNGPQNVLGDDARAHVLTAIAISDANIGVEASGIRDVYHEFYYELLNHPETYPSPPWYFEAYLAVPKSENLQTLAFYEVREIGYASATKQSGKPKITMNNPNYCLEGAEYGIYTGKETSEAEQVAVWTFDEEGNSNEVTLLAGTYYVRELKAPVGYKKSEEVITLEIHPFETTHLVLVDEPITKSVHVLLQKFDKESGLFMASGNGSLQDAWFVVKYYMGNADEEQEPDATWLFATDENGTICMQEAYLVYGDELYTEMPLGTLTVHEVKASKGYLLNETVFEQKLLPEEEFQTFLVSEEKKEPYQLIIQKKDDYGNLLEGAGFTLYLDEACSVVFAGGTTDTNGMLCIDNLEPETTYYLRETKTPPGYRSFQEEPYEIFTIDSPSENLYYLEIINEAMITLPKTGSYAMYLIPMSGIALCTISLYYQIRKRRITL